MFSATCLILSAAILFYILKYRVHIHVHITRESSGIRQSVRPARPAKVSSVPRHAPKSDDRLRMLNTGLSPSGSGTRENESQQATTADLVSALRNLGATSGAARIAAARAAKETQDFGQALKLAIQYATKEAA
jgi:hypothetical protein